MEFYSKKSPFLSLDIIPIEKKLILIDCETDDKYFNVGFELDMIFYYISIKDINSQSVSEKLNLTEVGRNLVWSFFRLDDLITCKPL